jgi:hypothetical protein
VLRSCKVLTTSARTIERTLLMLHPQPMVGPAVMLLHVVCIMHLLLVALLPLLLLLLERLPFM